MTALLIVCGIIALVVLLLFTGAGFHFISEEGNARLYFKFGFLRIKLVPQKEKKPGYKKTAKKLKGKNLSEIKPEKKKKKSKDKKGKVKFPRTGDAVDDLISAAAEKSDDPQTVKALLTALRELARDFGKTLKITLSRFQIKIDAGDAALTAIVCGGITAALSLSLEYIDSNSLLNVSSPEKIGVIPAFDGSGNDFAVNIDIRMRVIDLIKGFIKGFSKNNIKISTQKKGQKNERQQNG